MFSGLWTIPNLITLIRLLCLPVFLWLLFSRENRRDAAWLLGILGATDWVDGFLARRLGQTSEFGKVFDPTVDRLLFLVGIVALIIDGSVPVWFAVAVGVREVLVGGTMLTATVVLKMERFDVTWWGKCATFGLYFAFPGLLQEPGHRPNPLFFTHRRPHQGFSANYGKRVAGVILPFGLRGGEAPQKRPVEAKKR